MFATALLTTALLPVVGAADPIYDCTPSADPGATQLDTTPVTYIKEYRIGNALHVEHWQENNGVAGLQRDASWNCGGAADKLLQSECTGCPLSL